MIILHVYVLYYIQNDIMIRSTSWRLRYVTRGRNYFEYKDKNCSNTKMRVQTCRNEAHEAHVDHMDHMEAAYFAKLNLECFVTY